MSSIKIAKTNFPILDIIKNRWSARAFSDQAITEEYLNTIFEAASWAASAMNEQPWQYQYAHKGSKAFETIWGCLSGGNQPWAKNAAVYAVSIARKTTEANGIENAWAHHDLGMANAHLLLQARALDIYCHQMAGFDKPKLIEQLGLTENQDPICVIALGFLDHADTLEEPYKTRETTERKRKNISDFVSQL